MSRQQDLKSEWQLAVENNIHLCGAILRGQNLPTAKTTQDWHCCVKAPPYYPNIITRSREWKPDAVFEVIEKMAAREHWDGWSIKDSYACLDLASVGFKKLFDAKWVFLSHQNFHASKLKSGVKFKVIRDSVELASWCAAWDSNVELGAKIFHADLLSNQELHFIAGYEGHRLMAGCLLNQSSSCIGISNFFAQTDRNLVWSSLVEFIYAEFGQVDVVGYERAENCKSLVQLGYETVGELAVLAKTRSII